MSDSQTVQRAIGQTGVGRLFIVWSRICQTRTAFIYLHVLIDASFFTRGL